ncbi:MAG TPA: 16S rRNA (guanine(966)-N(2))-methyltransferase RsmD [Ignavibacteriaceae bacterium]|nr:16S rRNA (guanine(966)-N(2))-methyltransferase RsmD [Ignavibacteriaceae bacterium]
MRIISGELKGRLIKVPDSKLIRPTTDRVRETLFNLLNNRISFDGIKVLDLYAGSGALGLECLSRGAAFADFVERNFVIYKNLSENINSLNLADRCKIYKMETVKFTSLSSHPSYDLILADPPFFKDDIYKVVQNLLDNNFLNEGSSIFIERSVQTKEKDTINFKSDPFKIIGDACLYQLNGN